MKPNAPTLAALAASVLLAAVVALSALPGCEAETAPKAEDTCEPFTEFPGLALGNWWEYERVEWEEQQPDHVYAVTTSIDAADTLQNGAVAWRVYDDSEGETYWLLLRGCDLRLYRNHPDAARDYLILLRTPFAVGASWKYTSSSSGGFALQAEIVATDDTVSVPAGTFTDCIHVHVEPYYDTWFSLETGIVAAEYLELGGAGGWRDELVDLGGSRDAPRR